MKNLLWLVLFIYSAVSFSQVGIGTGFPDESAILDLHSTDRGFLPPRMTRVQRDMISNPAAGLLVFDVSENGYFLFDGTTWVLLTDKPYVYVKDFGAVGDGVVDDTDAINNAIIAAHNTNTGVVFEYDRTYITEGLSISNLSQVPTFIDGNGSTLQSKTGSVNPIISIENPHGIRSNFVLKNFTLDGNSIATNGLYVHGSQGMNIENITVINAISDGVRINGEFGYGVYYNHFQNIRSGIPTEGNGGDGFDIRSLTTASYVGNNTFISMQAQSNLGHGWDVDWVNFTCINCSAEKNSLYGFNVNNTYSFDLISGYSEQNHQNYGSGTSDGSADESMYFTANSTGVKVLGGRHTGLLSGVTNGSGNVYTFTNNAEFSAQWITSSSDDLGISSSLKIQNNDGYPHILKMAGDYSVFEATNSTTLTINEANWQKVVIPNGNVGIGTSTPKSKLSIVGLIEYTNNASAISAGLTVGDLYRSGDYIKIVH